MLCVSFVFGLGMTAAGVGLATVIAEYAGLGAGLLVVRGTWRGHGGWPGWARILVLERFRRLLAVNRDLFLRSLLLEAVFVAFTALSSRQGELVLAANAILLTYFTAAAYGLDGFAHAAEAMVGRAVGARDRPGFRAAVRASFANAALLALLMTLAFAVLGGLGVRLMTGLVDVRAQAMIYLPYAVALPAVSVWAFLYDGMFFGATRTAELRNGMVVALALFGLLAWLLVPAYGNHGLWLAFLGFLGARAVILAAIYRRVGGAVGFVPI
jgi:MATE family multidrug resistance protein